MAPSTAKPARRPRRPKQEVIPPQPEQRLRDDMYLTFAEAAAYARCTPRQIERWVVETGVLPGVRLPQGTRVRGQDLRDFMDARLRR